MAQVFFKEHTYNCTFCWLRSRFMIRYGALFFELWQICLRAILNCFRLSLHFKKLQTDFQGGCMDLMLIFFSRQGSSSAACENSRQAPPSPVADFNLKFQSYERLLTMLPDHSVLKIYFRCHVYIEISKYCTLYFVIENVLTWHFIDFHFIWN